MTSANWIATIGIVITVILSRLDARSGDAKTKESNRLTRRSIKEARRYNDLIAITNHKILKQRRSEEAMMVIGKFNARIWPELNKIYNNIKHESSSQRSIKSLLNVMGLYKSWSMFLRRLIVKSFIMDYRLDLR